MKLVLCSLCSGLVLISLTSCNSSPLVNRPGSEQSQGNPSQSNQSQVQSPTIVKVAASSSTSLLLEILAEAYQAKVQTVKIEFATSNQSGSSIAAVGDNLVDIAGSSHPLKPEENNGKLQYREVAKDPLMVATHSSVTGVKNLSKAQLQGIYSGAIQNWKELGGPDAAIVVLDRPEDESAKKLLRKHYLGETPTTSKAIILKKEGELIQSLRETPYSIGAFSHAYSLIKQVPVNPLRLDDTEPSVENGRKGTYPMLRQMGIIWNKQPSSATAGFVEFIFSPEAEKLLQSKGFIPSP
ncbi:MAG: phosphate ABC transporter substrate-binding protein [Alkalinema sp. CACIAM 70d]|nr:MAG: phosphate ABC transporter substrate-binding protein [Alkalinema sp. CACIAM 70d]